ncbi:hypothetical protein P3S67_018482 [Capsicum chacoense]
MATITSLKGNHIWQRIAMHGRTNFVGKPAALIFGKFPCSKLSIQACGKLQDGSHSSAPQLDWLGRLLELPS